MIVHRKLIRDRIPGLLEARGVRYEVRELGEREYAEALDTKLQEELREYLEAAPSGRVEELADLMEVVYAILENDGVSPEAFEAVRLEKKTERGGFEKRLLLEFTREPGE
ncbi:hypothetical protein J31TS4_06450 [Paenibacillus sp. J31TS4]|uniref:nucleoside triphosphate pyrophosphohydrolase n=1 Tax=Paenibacillus sp. J31TS4 TaxID=2807195 RepID=UPI001B0B8DE8|nr:nucleoside triphosphate pyrophosphohydrolase [Paenibacillus sp. J31TS4]GIP37365.1 hypothetical protein J31TS4_06450 [Paenibacillus sp. J31TS4]